MKIIMKGFPYFPLAYVLIHPTTIANRFPTWASTFIRLICHHQIFFSWYDFVTRRSFQLKYRKEWPDWRERESENYIWYQSVDFISKNSEMEERNKIINSNSKLDELFLALWCLLELILLLLLLQSPPLFIAFPSVPAVLPLLYKLTAI